MAEYLIQDTSLDAIADAINAKTGGSAAMTPAEMVTAIGAISGGTTITDGIVVKARDANGLATEIDFYGTKVDNHQFYNRATTEGAWIALSKVNFKNSVTEIGQSGFYCCGALTTIDLSSIETLRGSAFQNCGFLSVQMPVLTTIEGSAFLGCSSMTSVNLPKITSLNNNMIFRDCSSLQTVEIGSIGYGITTSRNNIFQNCTQTGLTITVYSIGSYADTLVTNIRNGATNATIIIKASEATTYNGTSYAAGDTILTSTP